MIADEGARSPDEIASIGDSLVFLHNAMKELLDEREILILRLRWGLNGNRVHTLQEISVKIKRTRERVRQIQKNAERKLRRKITADIF